MSGIPGDPSLYYWLIRYNLSIGVLNALLLFQLHLPMDRYLFRLLHLGYYYRVLAFYRINPWYLGLRAY